MTRDPISIEPFAPVSELARLLTDHEISGVPVVDAQDRVVGVVSKTDLLRWAISRGESAAAGAAPSVGDEEDIDSIIEAVTDEDEELISDIMSGEPFITSTHASLKTLASMMAEERVHRVIIVDDDGCLEGIVTSLDLLRAFAEEG